MIEHSRHVLHIRHDRIAFRGMSSWYTVPDALVQVFQRGKRTGRKVTFTVNRECNILVAETMPRRGPFS